MTTSNTVSINEIPVDPIDPTKTAWGPLLSTQYFFALVNGTAAGETFDAADISNATRTLMATYGRGISVVMGAGDDTVIGSGFGDTINAGTGTNYIDGGANAGTTPDGSKARDVLNVFATDAAAAAALQVVAIAADATGADGNAYAAGYRIKVSNGQETDYLKDVEQINVFRTDQGNTYVRTIQLVVDVREIAAGPGVADAMHFAWAQGTDRADSFDAQADVSSATRDLMTQHGRGVYVDMGAGNDTVVGSGFGDDITLGSGTNYADGGLNAGTTPWGGKPQDVLHVIVADAAAAAAVQVIQLAAGLSGLDAQAFTNGYTHKVVAGSEIDYVKGIERVTVQVATGNGGSTWVRDIPLETVVHEADLSASDLANYGHLAWASGTAGNDSINAADLLSAGVKAKMAELQKGIWIDGGSGNDTITGTAYGDNIRNGSGNAKIDGGANAGGMDVFEISVDSSAAMNAVQVAASDDPAYTWMVTYGAGTQKDYLKNIEAIVVNVAGTSTGKWIPLAVQVHEISADGDPANSMHHAWAQGTERDDSFDAASVSTATKALMTQHGRGVYVDMGAGNDTVVGSGYGDDITLGSGTNYADGGANAGSTPWGGKPQDVLHVIVANAGAAAAVQVVQLAAGLTGVDAQAFTNGYTHKVVAGSEIDYVKGIERVSVQVATGNGGSTWVRDIPLETVVHEADLSGNLAGNMHLAWINGTAGNDSINAADLLSSGVKTKMGELQKGVWIDGGSGNDTITGTQYGDNIRNGSGNARIDGGANAGGKDVFEIAVDSVAAMNAVVVAASDDPAYSFMVTYGNGQKDYLKNIEAIAINVTGSSSGKWIPLAVDLNEIAAGADLANAPHFAWAQGTDGADSFDAASVSGATKALMTQHGRGVYANMGAGDDTVVGSGYGDHVVLGTGTNYLDGGANAGTTPWGGQPADVLQVNVASQAAADAVQVLALASGMSGLDAQAFANGYTHKVVAGSEIDYIKGVERVTVMVNGTTWVRDVALAVQVQEAMPNDPNIGGYQHLAWINGTSGADSIDATSLLSDAAKQQMATRGKGVFIDGGAGNDSITGSAYGDLIRNGAGNAKIDGGANTGGKDIFEVVVASTAALNAVKVEVSDDPAYAFMVTYGSGTQKDYLKNVEAVSVRVDGGTAGKWIPLVVEVNPITSQTPASQMHFAGVQGTVGDDSFDAAAGLPEATKALMAQHGRGIYVDLGGGNDTVTGSAYGDNIVGGAGVNYIDGGANLGTNPSGAAAQDVLEMFVASQAAADAVAVTVLGAGSTGADLAAFNAGYKFKVANGTAEVNYLKNVEQVNVMVWNDKDGDGQRDGLPTSDPANEISFARGIALVANSAPTFAGVPAGVAVDGLGMSYVQTGGTVLADGKLLSVRSLRLADGSVSVVLARHNADGSIDTGFGGGSGRVELPTQGVMLNPAPLQLADGKIMLAVSTPGSSADFRIMRMNADGSLDTTYGNNGVTQIDFGASEIPLKLLLQADGKLVVAGAGNVGSQLTTVVAARLNADGSLDTGFGSGGKLAFAPQTSTALSHIAQQADGKLLVGGYVVGPAGNPDLSLVRYNVDGSLDTSFGNGGSFLLAVGIGTDNVRSINVLADGKILVGGTIRSNANDVDGVLLRLNANGTLDTSFGSAGIVKAHLTDANDVFAHIKLLPDGRFIVYGSTGASNTSPSMGGELMVARYLANGQPDTSFGSNGITRVPGHGIALGTDPGGLALVDGKIVIFGTTITDPVTGSTQPVIARLNADGSLDASFHPAPVSSVGGSVQANGVLPVALDTNAAIYDADLQARGNYGGASLKVARQGGASAEDLFSAVGEVSFAGGQLSVAGTVIGTVTQSGGSLTLNFNAAATQGLVNRAMHGIGYSNGSANPPNSVLIDWTFSDGNSGNQGFGGALSSGATSEILIGTSVREVVRSLSTPANSTDGQLLSSLPFMATVYGSARGESFDSNTQLSPAVRALMAELGRGARFDLGAGDDTLVGTGGSDEIYAGSGTNRIDGGGQAGTYPFGGGPGRDTLHVLVADQAAANAVSVTRLAAGMTGADGEAFAAGYEVKVVNGSEIDYVKNVEMIKIFRWADANGNKTAEGNELTWMREIPVALRVYETAVSTTDPTKATDGRLLKDIWHLASAEGWERNDSFDATTDVSSAAQQLMAQQGRGVWVDGGAGDDTLAGSAYGDNFIGGAGTNYIDGRANGGSTPNGQRPEDVLEIYVDSQARANAVQAIVLDAASTGADAQAFTNGYTWKVVDGDAVNYVKNVEAVNIFIWTDANGNHLRDQGEAPHARHIRLAASVNEISRHPTDPTKDAGGNPLSGAMHMAWVNGSAGADSFNAASDISSATRGLMDQYQRGVFVETYAGNDTVTGSAYGDNFITGAGVNRIDGGDNRGTHPAGGGAFDMLEIYVATQAEADAVAVTALTSAMTGADGAAWNDGYRYKVVNGAVSTDYIKNIEQLNVMVWTDKDGDGQRDWGTSDTDPAREISYTRSVGLVDNTAPSFAGTPAGIIARDQAADAGTLTGTVLRSGKLLTVNYVADSNDVYSLVLERSNADGSLDTSFGGGSGRVPLSSLYGSAAVPVELADGKLLLTHVVAGGMVRVARLNADGSLDASFGTNGAVQLSVADASLTIYRQMADASGKLTLIGHASTGASGIDMVAMRLNADGSLDTGFNGTGQLRLAIPNASETMRAGVLQADGKLLIVGYGQGGFNQDVVAMRFNVDGSFDTSFGTGGKTIVKAGTGMDGVDVATSMQLLPNGQILVAGYTNAPASGTTLGSFDGILMRLNANGSIDTSFGNGGTVRAITGAMQDFIYEVAVQADGSIITYGMTSPTNSTLNSELVIARFRADGSRDTAFGNGGEVRLGLRGVGGDAAELHIVDGKILVFGTVYNGPDGDASPLLVRLNADGSLDASFVQPGATSLGNTVRADGRHFYAIDGNVAVFDAELAARGNYGGATVSVARQGGAQADDLFAAIGDVSFANGRVSVAGTDIGSVSNSGGQLVLSFNNSATQALVNRALHGIGYASASTAPPASVSFGWTFSDGNTGGQGLGGALTATGTSTVEIGLIKLEVAPLVSDPTRTIYGQQMTQVQWMATINGSARTETVDAATDIGGVAQGLMSTYGRGAMFEMGGGGDTVTGTGFSDEFVMGQGVNRIDGGANAGTHPQGGAGKDQLSIYVANQAQADAVRVLKLDAGMTGDDGAAFAAGFEAKVTNGTEIDYIKNVERVVVSIWNDADGDRIRDNGEVNYVRDVPLQPRVFTIAPENAPLPQSYHFAWIDGWARNDSINVATDVPEATRNLMAQYQRGVYIDGGAGDDTIVGSGFGDNIVAGSGTNRVDGGANAGTTAQGGKVQDILDIYVRTTQEAGAVVATALTAAMTGADGAAYADGYRWKVVAGQETDYLKNIEAVNVTVWNDANGNTVRDNGETQFARQIAFETHIDEVRVSTTDTTRNTDGVPLAETYHFAWAHGTVGDDVIDTTSISQTTRNLMDQYKRGMWGQLGDGNDRVIGSAYGDNIDLGKGVNRFDGGTDIGTRPDGSPIFDVLEIHVRSQAEANAVAVTKLTAAMTGEDAIAFGEGYVYKVTGPDQVNYIKNVEQVYVGIWNDADGDGEIDHSTEVSFGRMIDVEQNAVPRFGPQQGVAVVDHGWDFTPGDIERGPDGKLWFIGGVDEGADDDNYQTFLARHNADGTVDTSFGNGAGYLILPLVATNGFDMAVQADGKVIVALGINNGANSGLKVLRYHANGTLDTSFGSNGETLVVFGSTVTTTGVLVGPDGAVVVTGTTPVAGSGTDFAVARLNASGSLDTGFNSSGKLTLAVSAFGDFLTAAQLQADGKLVLAGTSRSGTTLDTSDFAVVRVNTNGSLDSSFGTGGKVIVPVGTAADSVTNMTLLPGGAILLGGNSNNGSNNNAALVKLDASGALVSGFGNGGKVHTPADTTPDLIYASLVQADGKIVVAGQSGTSEQMAVTRYNADGTLDTSFGKGGTTLLTIGGLRDYVTGMVLDGDKIVLMVPAYFNTGADSRLALLRLNVDGSLDTSFAPGQYTTLGSTVRTYGTGPVVLDHNAMVHDANLAERGNYGGASVTVERQGGRNADDVFSLTGEVSASGGQLSVGGTVIGSVTVDAGMLRLDFNASATQGLVNRALHGIAYANKSANPPSSVTIGWSFNDGNTHNEQGGGGIGFANGHTVVEIAPVAREVARSYFDPARSSDMQLLTGINFFASVTGTKGGDTFGPDDLSPQVRALMAEFNRGATYQMMGGNDTVTGTGFSDEFILGNGVNHVDGGANAGGSPYGSGPGEDTLIVYVPNQAAADAITANMLTPMSTGADAAAFAAGYEAKIVSGSQVDYIRNVEQVSVHLWTDTNGNGIVDGVEGTYLHNIQFRTHVSGRQVATPDAVVDVNGQVLADQWHFAWASGFGGDDMVIVEQRLNASELALMNQYQRGAWINLGDGNDVVTTTAYGDNINVGKGTNWIDGGANGGTTPNGSPVNDVLEINTASLAERKAVTFQVLNGSMTGEDGRAFAAGYQFKVMTQGETDYVKNVELLAINVWNDANGNGQPDDGEITEQIWVTPDLNATGIVVIGTPQG